jgi:poly-gamma-glutamate synthase PgsB/CapB
MVGFVIVALILTALMTRWHRAYKQHERRLQHIRLRIHVNGIRGKSTVTRLVAGVLRESGYETVAKTTGSAAMVIHEDGSESPIQRRGAATIVEQIDIVRQHVKPTTEALVIECMAVHPLYQRVAQEQIVKGNITIITNVREDHQEVMGGTLPEIAEALSHTIPYGGLLITAEERAHLRAQLARNAQVRGSGFLYADQAWVTDEDLQGFDYLSFKENLAIGLAVAKWLDIPRAVALRGMRKAWPDIGVVCVQRTQIGAKEIVWAPLFAVNDRESTVMGTELLKPYHRPDATRIGILNNRLDRAVRALQFAEIAARDLDFDYYITFGAYEKQVTARMIELGVARERIVNLGFSKNPTLQEILRYIVALTRGEQALLIGMVNIHTPQAELLMEYFHSLKGQTTEANIPIANLRHVPTHGQRQCCSLRHFVPCEG